MKKYIPLLGGLLVIQLALALLVNLGGEDYGAFQAEEELLVFHPEQVNGLRIEGESQSVLLRKQGDKWVLPEQENFPANQESVKRLIDKLAGLEKGWPVATSSSAAAHFQVAESDYQRHLTLLHGDDVLARLYVGSSPGFRKAHVRPAGEQAVYSVDFNAWEAGVKSDDWIDRDILRLDMASVQRIELPDQALQREGDSLQPVELAAGETVDLEKVKRFLSQLSSLVIDGVLSPEAKPEYLQEATELTLKLTHSEVEPLNYRFSKPEDAGYYVLKRSDLDYYFKLTESAVKPLLESRRADWIETADGSDQPPETAVGEEPEASGNASGEDAG